MTYPGYTTSNVLIDALFLTGLLSALLDCAIMAVVRYIPIVVSTRSF